MKNINDNKIRLLIFDLDSTLAPIGKGIGEVELKILKKIDETGVKLAIASGKTCDYLCGFFRQVGLKNPILIGENGAMIQFGVELPPQKYLRVPVSKKAEESLKRVREILDKEFTDLWYQPNQVEVTPFPREESRLDLIEEWIEHHRAELPGIVIHRQCDCFDFVPEGIDKATGISYLLRELRLDWDNVMAIGDGINDYGMFEKAAVSLGVRVKEKERVDYNFEDTREMLEYLLKFIDFLTPFCDNV